MKRSLVRTLVALVALWSWAPVSGSGAAEAALSPAAVPELAVSSVRGGLEHPWDLAFTPDGTMVVTERPGRIWARLPDGTTRQLTADLSDLFVSGETGLMSVEPDPGFSANRRLYTCQGREGPEGRSVAVVAWVADPGWTRLDRVADPLVGGLPATSGRHGGCRLRFGADFALYVGTGDAADADNPQNLASLGGKVLRVDPANGLPPPDNPFLNVPGSDPRLFTAGHRNVQGLALRPGTTQMWAVEHGPDRDDEINLQQGGGNYGWRPGPGYDESVPMTADGVPAVWSSGVPTVATSGATFLVGPAWGDWEGALAVAELRGAALEIFTLQGDAIVASTRPAALAGTFGRLRTPRLGPDGALYVTTDNGGDDQVLRIAPA
jgi:glucose/arabinose dehydrogenase